MIREWLDRLTDRIEIDWLDFGVTRGCFVTGLYGSVLADERTEQRDVVIASGGLCVPSRTRWDPWARWFHLPRLADPPPFSSPRGGIRYRDPDELLGSKLCFRKLDGDDDDPNTPRCHEYLKRDGDRWRCRAGHVWNAVGVRVE